ncbi:MAG: hypothetical protein RIA69_11790 [Cyclobacteriaceae bacterium]
MKNEILLIYDSNDFQNRETKGYAKALSDHKIKEIDLSKDSLTEKQIGQLAERLGGINAIINKNKAKFQDQFANSGMEEGDWLKVLSQNQDLIKSPVALYPNTAEFINSPYEFLRKDMNDNKHSFSYQK